MELVTTLEPAPSGGVFTTFSSVLRLRDGRYLVANEAQDGEIEVYSASGRYLRTIGRKGEGPGEFTYIRDMRLGDADSVIVSDVTTGRLTVLAPDLTFGRVIRFPYRHREFRKLRRGYVFNGPIATADAAGLTLHFIDERGQIVRSFGLDTAMYRPDFSGLNSRPLATDENGRIWAGYVGQYVIDVFDGPGARDQRFVRNVDWFKPWVVHPALSREDPPLPQLTALRLNAEGDRLWVLALVPAPDYRGAFEPMPDNPGTYRLSDYYRLYYAVLEVLDAKTGEHLASRQISSFAFSFADDSHLLTYREGADLLPRLDVWKLSLTSATRQEGER